MASKPSLYHKYPEYRVDLVPNPRRVTVRVGDQVVADSVRTLRVLETRHDPVTYFPREDVRMDLLEPTGHHSFCPFKGDAVYWTVRAGGGCIENAVWGYPEPFEPVAGLSSYVSFYTDRVTQEEAG